LLGLSRQAGKQVEAVEVHLVGPIAHLVTISEKLLDGGMGDLVGDLNRSILLERLAVQIVFVWARSVVRGIGRSWPSGASGPAPQVTCQPQLQMSARDR
jgi:hypothetical protein